MKAAQAKAQAAAGTPLATTSSLSESQKKWIVVYPCYLDKNRSLSEGRKVVANLSVEAPKCDEIVQVLKSFKLEHLVEDKRHPADFFTPGRVRVRLFDDDGKTPLVADIPSKKVKRETKGILFFFCFIFLQVLLNKLGEWIPQLKSRVAPAPVEKSKTSTSNKKKQPTTKPKKKK